MNLFIASDHGGFILKNKIIALLNKDYPNISVKDAGPKNLDPEDDYTDYTFELVNSIQNNANSQGILICRSGIGVSIAANKGKGIYAALCFTPEHAVKAREHNNANVLCLDADFEDEAMHYEIVKSFLNTDFSNEERHVRRLNEIKQFEEKSCK